jgi:hypothetical protein
MVEIGQNGYLGGSTTNDIWQYGSNSWTLVSPNTATTTAPNARDSYAMGTMSQEIIIFGGSSDGKQFFDDIWTFDTELFRWTKRLDNFQFGSPSARYNNANFACTNFTDCYLFGGRNSTALNDLWRLRKVSMKLYDVRTSSSIYPNAPFNLSWRVNTTGGANQHTATIDFNGTKYPPQNYSNTFASILLNAPSNLKDFYISLMTNDTEYPAASVRQLVNFTLND